LSSRTWLQASRGRFAFPDVRDVRRDGFCRQGREGFCARRHDGLCEGADWIGLPSRIRGRQESITRIFMRLGWRVDVGTGNLVRVRWILWGDGFFRGYGPSVMDFAGAGGGGVEGFVSEHAARAVVLAGADRVELTSSHPALDGCRGDTETLGRIALTDRLGRAHRRLRSAARRLKRWSWTIRRLPLLAPTATIVKRSALTQRSIVGLLTPSI
jgi:hypothetical protein